MRRGISCVSTVIDHSLYMQSDLSDFDFLFSGLQATLDAAERYQRTQDRELALNFNPLLSFFKIGENQFSSMLAFFLNPKQAHGQGDVFLKAFLKQSCLDERIGNWNTVDVITEQPTEANRRIDIFLRFDSRQFAIGIENKIWAADQREQLKDYSAYLKRHFSENQCLLYMPPYEKKANSWTIPEADRETLETAKQFLCFDHSVQTSALLETWISICQAANVRIFLKQLHQFIQHEINGESVMGQNELVADFILAGDKRLDLAHAISKALGLAYDNIVTGMKPRLRELARACDMELDENNYQMVRGLAGNRFFFLFPEGTDAGVSIGFEWSARWFDDGNVGFCYLFDNPVPLYRKKMPECFGRGESSKSWAFWEGMAIPYRKFAEQTYHDLHQADSPFLTYIQKAAKELRRELIAFTKREAAISKVSH